MADALTNTTTIVGQHTMIETRTLYLAEKLFVFRKLITPGFRVQVPAGSRIANISQQDSLTFAATTQATAQDSEAFTTTQRSFTPATIGTNILEAWEAQEGTPISNIDMYAEAAATAWAALEDDNSTLGFAHIYGEAPSSTPDHEIGTDAVALTAYQALQGAQLLRTAGCAAPYHWVIDPIQWKELMSDADARQWLQLTRDGGMGYAATLGIQADRYLGQIHGVNVWVANALVESSGLHSMMFGQGAIGQAYKLISTPLSPTPSEFNVEIDWESNKFARRISYRVCMFVDGVGFTNTTNKFIVDIIS